MSTHVNQRLQEKVTRDAVRAQWPPIRKRKVLEPLSMAMPSTTAVEIGDTWTPMHDDEANRATSEWMCGPWTEERIASWNLWKDYYLPTLCQASQDGTIVLLGRAKEGHRSFMESVLQCLDDLFFGGNLAPYCTFQWKNLSKDGDGLSFGKASLKDPGHVHILADARPIPHVLRLIGTLLHELCHAHQYLLGCCSGQYCGTCARDEEYEIQPLHPFCFFDLSWYVESLACSLHGREVSLGRGDSWIYEVTTVYDIDIIRFHFTREDDFEDVAQHRWSMLRATEIDAQPTKDDLAPNWTSEVATFDSRIQPPAETVLSNAVLHFQIDGSLGILHSHGWPWIIPTRMLVPLPSGSGYSRCQQTIKSAAAHLTGGTWTPQHDNEATRICITRIKAPWTDQRRDAWKLWTNMYFPMVCRNFQGGTMKLLGRTDDGMAPAEGSMRSVMEHVLQCLDEIFLGGQVAPYCTFRWQNLKIEPAGPAMGVTKPSGLAKMCIGIDLTTVVSAMELIGAILHELCHAYLLSFGCRQGAYCNVCPGNEVRTGHDDCFCEISKLVEDLATVLHDGNEVPLGRLRSFQLEHTRNNKIPSMEDIDKHFTRPNEHQQLLLHRRAELDKLKEAGKSTSDLGNEVSSPQKHQSTPLPASDLERCNAMDLLTAMKPRNPSHNVESPVVICRMVP